MSDNGLPQRKIGVRDIGWWRLGLFIVLAFSIAAYFKYRHQTIEQETLKQETLKQETLKQEAQVKIGTTGIHINGRAWNAMGADSKLSWVIGFNEGIYDAVRLAKPDTQEAYSAHLN